ncbi:MAG: haloacid dehalogenase-like hydrolase [bacterium]|nr:haloacid dehalogenase-like hydrolase [bacterium]
MRLRRLAAALVVVAVAAFAAATPARAADDPLPSWNDGPRKQAILRFVEETSRPGPSFVPVPERIATFDNDGTLWVEMPFYTQLAFAIARVKALAPRHPEWTTKQPFADLLAGNVKGALAAGEPAIVELVMVTHANTTTAEFERIVTDWIATAKHPRWDRPYTELVYQPMLELMAHLRANGWKTYIVSGGGVEFMRPWTERVYGVPPEQVVGSSAVTKWQVEPSGPVLFREAKIFFVDDGPGKPVGINAFIGRRPRLAFGNSDGDQQMLEWTAAGDGPRFMGLVHHTDAAREYAYDRRSDIGRLDEALGEATAKGWSIVDMQHDWKRIFPFE